MNEAEPIPTVAARRGIDPKRLRGKVWQEHQTGALDLPIGDLSMDVIYDDWRVEKLSLGDRKS